MLKSSWLRGLTIIGLVIFISGCSPEVGSTEWCVMMKEKPKGDWTANEAGDYAQHCLL
ncbi:MAG TPA: DUF3012 domain-containing protein [Methylophaga sp.]|nr:DUF3012 domain-containing protein [Methylophaga sp.]